jgi:hypothetical protein
LACYDPVLAFDCYNRPIHIFPSGIIYISKPDYGLAGAYPGVGALLGPGVRALYVPVNPGVCAVCAPGVAAVS